MNWRTPARRPGLPAPTGAVILRTTAAERVKKSNLVTQLDRCWLGARERIPLGERGLLVEQFADRSLELEQVVGAVARTVPTGR